MNLSTNMKELLLEMYKEGATEEKNSWTTDVPKNTADALVARHLAVDNWSCDPITYQLTEIGCIWAEYYLDNQ